MSAGHARQDIVEIGVWCNAIQLAGLDERAHRRPTGFPAIAAGEEMILAAKRHRPDGALDRVRVELMRPSHRNRVNPFQRE